MADFRLNVPGIMPKATITVDKWGEAYGAFKGSNGAYITVHDGDEVTPEMMNKTNDIIRTLRETEEQGKDLCEAVDEYTSSIAAKYATKLNKKGGDSIGSIINWLHFFWWMC